MGKLCDYEVEILRECAGEIPARPWGAAVGAALEALRGNGYVDRTGHVTAKGRQYLAERESGS